MGSSSWRSRSPAPSPATGCQRLWRHQTAGIAAVRRGEGDVLVTTPTAVGQVAGLPGPAARGGGPRRAGARAVPLPAQGAGAGTAGGSSCAWPLRRGIPPDVAGCEIYDGDNPDRQADGGSGRNFPRVVISNPDMLHLGIPRPLDRLGAVPRRPALDRARRGCTPTAGIFGSHFHHVLQRFLPPLPVGWAPIRC